MLDPLINKAIQASLIQDWTEAIKFNTQYLRENPNNISALNRLACAFFESGNLEKAATTYKKTLRIDPYSIIAQKNLQKIELMKNSKTGTKKVPAQDHNSLQNLFLNEPGKTKIVSLVNLAPFDTLSALIPSQTLNLTVKKRSIVCSTGNCQYIGVLPDDLSFRLSKLILGGNKYEVNIQSVKKNNLTILIRETFRSPRFNNQPSFS